MPKNGLKFISYFNTQPVDVMKDEEEDSRRILLENRDLLFAGSAYENKNFIENTLIIWACLGLTILFLPVLFIIKSCCCKEKAYKAIENYKFSVFIRFFLIFYLPIMLAC